tara:strand:+ start:352 stop:816 length:465 start_codon:yes stop_codon:yes gene_type:complete
MKIRVTVGETNKLNGYINVDPVSKFDDLSTDVRNLDDIAADAECTEIISEGVIDFLEKSDVAKALTNWTKKIRHGGKIVVTSIDAREVSKAFYRNQMTADEFNRLIHGGFSGAWDVYLSHTTAEELSSFFEAQGFKVTKKRINNFKLLVEACRP